MFSTKRLVFAFVLLAGGARAQLPDGAGKDVTIRICTKCHGAAVFAKLRMGRQAWEDEVTSMVEKGATGTEAELKQVVEYLAKNFGRESKVGRVIGRVPPRR